VSIIYLFCGLQEEVKSRVARAVEEPKEAASDAKDQEAAASDDQEGRDKRFLFSFGRQAEEGGQGSGGGSGNFLFDIIRVWFDIYFWLHGRTPISLPDRAAVQTV